MMQSITVIIPALNEEENIKAAIDNICHVVSSYFEDWEFIVFNDGSSDHTGSICDKIAATNDKIRVIHHATPKNLGACYKEGIELASKEYVIMLPGDNECGTDVMTKTFALAGQADLIIPYTLNSEVRPFGRRILSSFFTQIINIASGNKLKYYNGSVLHKTSLIKEIQINTDSFGYQAEALIKLLHKGHSFIEVGVRITYRPKGSSKAFRLENIIKVARFIGCLLLEERVHPLLKR